MILVDNQIELALKTKELIITNFDKQSLKPLAYVATVGKKVLLSGAEKEINLEKEGSITIEPGDFLLFSTFESFTLSDKIAGHIGPRSYFARKGLAILAGMHIDPKWDGHLVIGAYNSSPQKIVLDYKSQIINIEFHKLQTTPTKFAIGNDDQKRGNLPIYDKEYLRRLEGESLSSVSKDLRTLTQNVIQLTNKIDGLTQGQKWLKWGIGLIVAVLIAMGLGLFGPR